MQMSLAKEIQGLLGSLAVQLTEKDVRLPWGVYQVLMKLDKAVDEQLEESAKSDATMPDLSQIQREISENFYADLAGILKKNWRIDDDRSLILELTELHSALEADGYLKSLVGRAIDRMENLRFRHTRLLSLLDDRNQTGGTG